MKNVLLTLLLTAMLTGANSLKSAEIIPVWNKTVEGKVQDMEFLKGQNEILMLVGEGSSGQIQRRNPENGELLHSFPNPLSSGSKFALTPDSMRFIHIDGNGGALRAIDQNYKMLKFFEIEQEDDILITYSVIAIDPIRPFAYVTTYGWYKKTNFPAPRGKVIAYNYETGEHIQDLTPYGEDEYTAIEVSHDGKYLATLNDNKTYLKVWDLETMELIINEPLFDESDDRCEAEDIYFSKLDNNIIFISGFFSKREENKRKNGIFKFDIENRIRRRVIPDGLYDGDKMIFLNNESRIFNSGTWNISVLNMGENVLEYYNNPIEVHKTIVKYNTRNNYFIGASNNKLSKFLYDTQSSIDNNIEDEIIISPNPTNSIVNIDLNCTDSSIDYRINDINGVIVFQSIIQNQNGSLILDFTSYPTGIYFLTVHCNNQLKTYKIIKES